MKKIVALVLAAAMCLALAACGGSSAKDNKTYTLNLSTHDTNTAPAAVALAAWADDMRAKSDGRLDIQIHYNGTLAAMGDAVTMTATGGVDMCWNTVSINTNCMPLTEFTNYPGLPVKNTMQATKALHTMYQNYDFIQKEFEALGVKVLAIHANAPSLLSSKSVFNTVSDFNGDVIRANSTSYKILCEEFGMTQMACSVGEMYENFSKNVMNSTIVDITLVEAMHTYEVAPNIMNYNFGVPCGFVAVNNDSYNKLPDDLKALLDGSFEDLSFAIATNFNEKVQAFLADPAAMGITIYEPSDEIASEIQRVVDTRIMETWNAAAEAAGQDSAKLFDEFVQILNDAHEVYGAEYDWVQ